MARIVWLASYPKSGNTWVRFIIAALVRGEIKSSAEVARQVPDIHDGIKGHHLLGQHTTVVKTHWGWRADLPLREDTIGAICVVRNPLDVIESNQNYALLRSGDLRQTLDEPGLQKRSETFVDDFIANGGHARFQEFRHRNLGRECRQLDG